MPRTQVATTSSRGNLSHNRLGVKEKAAARMRGHQNAVCVPSPAPRSPLAPKLLQWFCGFVVWFCGFVVFFLFFFSSPSPLLLFSLLLLFFFVVLWFCGFMVLWFCGFMVLWFYSYSFSSFLFFFLAISSSPSLLLLLFSSLVLFVSTPYAAIRLYTQRPLRIGPSTPPAPAAEVRRARHGG